MTIKRRIRIALSLMIIVPVALMGLAFLAASGWYLHPGMVGPGGLPPLFSDAEGRFLAEFNRLVAEDPGALADPARLAELGGLLPKESAEDWSVSRDGRVIWRSAGAGPGEPRRWLGPGGMPGTGDMLGPQGLAGPRPGPRGMALPSDFHWSFSFPDGAAGRLDWSPGPRRGPMGEGGRYAFLGLVVMLVACNGLLGRWVVSGIVPPLGRLKAGALRIGEGDLDFRVEKSGDDELGELATAFETMRAKLQAALARQLAEEGARKELVAHVSHDLRTPVAVIRGHAEGLRDGVAATAPMRDRYLDAIIERSRELEALIELLFSYSRLDLEAAKAKRESLELLPFLDALCESLSRAYPESQLSLDAAVEPPGPRVLADPGLLRRALGNLVENAVKHGGRSPVSIVLGLRRLPLAVELSVRDDGEGVAGADLPRLFEPFFRGDRARGRGGSGLGLAIVGRIMELQGGSARAIASPSGGLEVILSLPSAPDVDAKRG